jgi:hypothetical protein
LWPRPFQSVLLSLFQSCRPPDHNPSKPPLPRPVFRRLRRVPGWSSRDYKTGWWCSKFGDRFESSEGIIFIYLWGGSLRA